MKQKSLEIRTCGLTLALNYFHGTNTQSCIAITWVSLNKISLKLPGPVN